MKRKREENNWLSTIAAQLGVADEMNKKEEGKKEEEDPENPTLKLNVTEGQDGDENIYKPHENDDHSDSEDSEEEYEGDTEDDEVYLSDDYTNDPEYIKAQKKYMKPKSTDQDQGEDEEDEEEIEEEDDEEDDIKDVFSMLQEQAKHVKDEGDFAAIEVEDTDMLKKLEEAEPSIFEDIDYDDDSSEDEGNVNTVGNVPLKWYEEYDHIGYDRTGKKIIRKPARDHLDELLRQADKPGEIEVYDDYNDRWVKLAKKDIEMLVNIQKGNFPSGYTSERIAPEFEYDSRFPISGRQDDKKTFVGIDSSQFKKVAAIAYKMKHEGYVPSYRREYKKKEENYLLWGHDNNLLDPEGIRRTEKLPPPPEMMPTHADSYNPSKEYIHDSSKTYDSMRKIPQPKNFVKNRLQRCMDLYLCPRVKGNRRRNKSASELLPDLPDPDELRPFPELQTLVYTGHTAHVRAISVSPRGDFLISGDAVGEVRLWEVETSRCLRVIQLGHLANDEDDEEDHREGIKWVSFNPNASVNLAAVACGERVYLIAPEEGFGSARQRESTLALFPDTEYREGSILEVLDDEDDTMQDENEEAPKEVNEDAEDVQKTAAVSSKSRKGRKKHLLSWYFTRSSTDFALRKQGIMCYLTHLHDVTQVVWHRRGDYFATLSPKADHDAVIIHHLTRRLSQKPFARRRREKGKGLKITSIIFHPKKNFFYISYPSHVKIYNLITLKRRKVLKKQKCKYISCMALHPKGDHLLIGGFDKRLEFFEAEISSKPCKSLRFHKKAVRACGFHGRYPLFASVSDDGYIHVFHCQIFNDWLTDPVIVPVKILKGHVVNNALGVLQMAWHPTQPWLFTSGADYTIRLWTA